MKSIQTRLDDLELVFGIHKEPCMVYVVNENGEETVMEYWEARRRGLLGESGGVAIASGGNIEGLEQILEDVRVYAFESVRKANNEHDGE